MYNQKGFVTDIKRFFVLVVVVLFETLSQQALRRGMEERVRDTRGEKIITARLNQLLQ